MLKSAGTGPPFHTTSYAKTARKGLMIGHHLTITLASTGLRGGFSLSRTLIRRHKPWQAHLAAFPLSIGNLSRARSSPTRWPTKDSGVSLHPASFGDFLSCRRFYSLTLT